MLQHGRFLDISPSSFLSVYLSISYIFGLDCVGMFDFKHYELSCWLNSDFFKILLSKIWSGIRTEPPKFLRWPQTYFCSYCCDVSTLPESCRHSVYMPSAVSALKTTSAIIIIHICWVRFSALGVIKSKYQSTLINTECALCPEGSK